MSAKHITRKRPYICAACAESMGGKWPRGHVATMHLDRCPYCGKGKTLASIGDWDWPKQQFRDLRD